MKAAVGHGAQKSPLLGLWRRPSKFWRKFKPRQQSSCFTTHRIKKWRNFGGKLFNQNAHIWRASQYTAPRALTPATLSPGAQEAAVRTKLRRCRSALRILLTLRLLKIKHQTASGSRPIRTFPPNAAGYKNKKTRPEKIGGVGRNRTDDEAFAEPCLTTWLPRPIKARN